MTGQRAQVETVFSMVKRNLGSALRARKPFAINREVTLRLIVHNLMVLRRRKICFQRSTRGSSIGQTGRERNRIFLPGTAE